jgi:hypothetical protein
MRLVNQTIFGLMVGPCSGPLDPPEGVITDGGPPEDGGPGTGGFGRHAGKVDRVWSGVSEVTDPEPSALAM